ncbi:MAG TPA: dihydropteroate synthase [Rhodospirillales bacterium]|nr:dihydropteroate synthase [Rhodospirillales bacterium]
MSATPTRVTVVGSPALPRGFLPTGGDPARRVYLCPIGLFSGSSLAFSACQVLIRREREIVQTTASVDDIREWSRAEGTAVGTYVRGVLKRLATPLPPFSGLALDRPRIMGIVNVTPDSFSEDGDTKDAVSAIARGRAMLVGGADIIDVGGESARPGAAPLASAEELARVRPVVRELAEAGAVVSIDSRHAEIMKAALEDGARIVNDITALAGDAAALGVVAASRAVVVLMHMQGTPQTMQDNPRYENVALDVYDKLAARVAVCTAAGIELQRIAVDPGIGFGKTLDDNLEILDRLALFRGLGCAVLLGVSRKSFLGSLAGGTPATERLSGSLAAALIAVARGANILRVHDVAETRQAFDVWEAIGGRSGGAAP